MKSTTEIVAVLVIMAGTAFSAPAPEVPDPARTPGAVNPAVTQENIDRTICKAGWTKTVRPPASYTDKLKAQQLAAWGYDDRNPKDYEEDHLISIELGGSPTDPRNLWPEPYKGRLGARTKDIIETKLKRLVCAHQIALRDAQLLIAHDWVGAYKRFVLGSGREA